MASKYGKKARKKVARAMHERKEGTLRSGSGRKVKSRKQAIAIGLSEARRAGGKVPSRGGRKRKSSSGSKRSGGKTSRSKSSRGKSSRSKSSRSKSSRSKSTRRKSSRRSSSAS